MKGQVLKIIFEEDKAFLAVGRPMTFQQLGLPAIAKKFKEPAFWTIRVLNYIETEKKIFCEIISYKVGVTAFDRNQIQIGDKLNEIEKISFKSIDTDGLLATLKGETKVNKNYTTDKKAIKTTENIKKSYTFYINEIFYVPLKNVQFKHGGVSFFKKFEDYKTTLELTISNYEIREEFDAIKNYFANVLKTKKIEVVVNIEITDNKVTSIEAKSTEIESINKELIDNVKFEFVKSTIKKKINIEIDKSLFTMDEYFDTFADKKFKSNTFYKDEKELFEDILSITNTKHYKHLRFLSSKHAHDILKLKFVHKPFSFIFLIQGDRNYHIIWETLDTEEATYVWHIAKDINVLKMTLRKIEDIINLIKVQGKTAYINSTEDPFRRIYHDYSEIVDGFVKWKGELESILT